MNSFNFLLKLLLSILSRSSHQRCSIKKGVLKSFVKFTAKHQCQSLLPATLLKISVWHRCFPLSFPKVLRTTFLQNTSGQLLLTICQLILVNYSHGNIYLMPEIKRLYDLVSKKNVTSIRSKNFSA